MDERVVGALRIGIGARVPMLLWGAPGVGKTTVVRQLAENSQLPCELVIASIREPADFSGLPVVGADGRSVHLAPPAWATRLAEAGRGLLFLDEISTAPPAVQAALMRVVLERTVGELQLPEVTDHRRFLRERRSESQHGTTWYRSAARGALPVDSGRSTRARRDASRP